MYYIFTITMIIINIIIIHDQGITGGWLFIEARLWKDSSVTKVNTLSKLKHTIYLHRYNTTHHQQSTLLLNSLRREYIEDVDKEMDLWLVVHPTRK